MVKLLKEFRVFILAAIAIAIISFIDAELGFTAVDTFKFSLREMMLIIPPVFVLLGLLDIWVPREVMVRYMGEGSGIIGIILSIFLGSAAAGPLYGAFPIATVFMKKGVSLTNVLIFIGAWSTTKIPMFLFELSSLGTRFALTRLMINIPGIIIIAYLIPKLLKEKDIEEIYKKAELIDEE